MVTSTYALRESSKANSLKNLESPTTSYYKPAASSYSSEFYTEKDPQYYQYTFEEKMPKSSKKSSKRGGKPGRPSSKTSNKKSRTVSSSSTFLYNDDTYRVRHPGPNDVLCGRGGSINNHPGNKAFRAIVSELKNTYNLTINKQEKAVISQSIVDRIHDLEPAGRFLAKDEASSGGNWWVEVDNNKAMSKTSQALREGAPTIRAAMGTAVKDATKTSTTSVLGKRKRVSRKTYYYNDMSDEDQDESYLTDEMAKEEVDEAEHPLIVCMANGHRGKQLIPRTPSPTQDDFKATKNPLHENTLSNTFVSFDEDNNNNSSNRVDANAETPPPYAYYSRQEDQEYEEIPPSYVLPSLNLASSNGPSSHDLTIRVGDGNQRGPPALAMPETGFIRAHSLISSEINGFDDGFRGDETFVDPFLNDESKVFNDLGKKVITGDQASEVSTAGAIIDHYSVDHNYANKESSGHCSVWSVHSDYQAFPDDGSENFYEGVRKIHGITHPDITTPMNGKDSIPTHLVPNNKSLVSPIISNRRYIAKMEEFLSRKSSSSSSSVKFDIVNNQ